MEAPSLRPYSHSRLGKFVLDYHHDCNKDVSKINWRDTNGRDLMLSIPESELTWKGGSKTQGTQMLVFRATQSLDIKPETAKDKSSQLVSSTSSASNLSTGKKTARKTVALELNRINPASLAKLQSQATVSSTVQSYDQAVGEGGSRLPAVDCQAKKRNGSIGSAKNVAIASQNLNGHVPSSVTNNTGSKSSSKQNRSSNSRKQQVDTSIDDSEKSGADVGQNLGSARTEAFFRKKPDTKEVGVMTDLCGIDSVLDLSPVNSKPSKVDGATNRKRFDTLHLSLDPRPSLKTGCVDRCTSPGFPSKYQPFTNGGGFNGLIFNGYASPDVLTLRAGPGTYQRNKKALSLLNSRMDKRMNSLVSLERNGQLGATMTHKDPETGEIRLYSELLGGARAFADGSPGARRGGVPFTISIPRTILSPPSQQVSDMESAGELDVEEGTSADKSEQVSSNIDNKKGGKAESLPAQQKSSSTSSSTYRRRSEIQLLLDGDKPPSERISASEVPIFTAEDLSSRNTRSTGGGGAVGGASGGGGGGVMNKPWLDSSTRKITPVAHFDHSYFSFPQKFTGIVSSHSTSTASNVSSAANSRKRSVSDSESTVSKNLSSESVITPPPPKQQKVSGSGMNTSTVMEESKGESSQGGDPTLSECSSNGVVCNPSQDATQPVSTLSATNKSEIDGCDVDSESSSKSDSNNVSSLFHPDDVFTSEVVVFDSRGDCLLQEGEYSIMMQRCSNSKRDQGVEEMDELLTFPPLTWSSVFGGCNEIKVGEQVCF